jgi:hypothetical protein
MALLKQKFWFMNGNFTYAFEQKKLVRFRNSNTSSYGFAISATTTAWPQVVRMASCNQ